MATCVRQSEDCLCGQCSVRFRAPFVGIRFDFTAEGDPALLSLWLRDLLERQLCILDPGVVGPKVLLYAGHNMGFESSGTWSYRALAVLAGEVSRAKLVAALQGGFPARVVQAFDCVTAPVLVDFGPAGGCGDCRLHSYRWFWSWLEDACAFGGSEPDGATHEVGRSVLRRQLADRFFCLVTPLEERAQLCTPEEPHIFWSSRDASAGSSAGEVDTSSNSSSPPPPYQP